VGLEFKGQWRSYQKRILDSLNYHLCDDKLHIIAAPGAGKTTLGIEVVSRLKSPTLVLCPTNTIKSQWRDRICKSFLSEDEYDLISTDIKNPKFITVITYQALLAAFCGGKTDNEDVSEEFREDDDYNDTIVSSKRFNSAKAEKIIQILKCANISVLCFDEAHHLRKEWWKSLTYLVENLQPRQTVALTATPPYDVSYSEWQRYEELCGEIDEVISIPELVKNGDLCPHQDFVHFSLLRENESDFIKKHNMNISKFISKLLNDRQLLVYLKGISALNPVSDLDVEKIFENPEFYVSIASLLKSSGFKVNKAFLELFDAGPESLPKFNLKQAKLFLNGFLITNCAEFPEMEEKISQYLALAKSLGLVQNKRIVLDESSKIQKQIAGSVGKLDSIVQIVDLENQNLGHDLRMVILADYIKENDVDCSHLGVIPIWRTIKDKFPKIQIGVLCGSLILLPWDCERYFYQLLEKDGLSRETVTVSGYKQDNKFIKITPKESLKNKIVAIITELFNQGFVNVLVGTQALLGEGWDAPCINSLILSSTVSSYMLSNQMRGRAIRIDKNNPNKISNIWHLASVKIPKMSDVCDNLFQTINESEAIDTLNAGMYDILQLEKRFEGFEAPSYYSNHEIRNGFSRVFKEDNYRQISMSGERVFKLLNAQTMELAKNRAQTKKWWDEALNLGYNNGAFRRMVTGVETPALSVKTLCYTGYKQIFYSIVCVVCGLLFYCLMYGSIIKELWLIAAIIFLGAISYVGFNYLKTGSVEGVMKQVAIVHLETLAAFDFIKTSIKNTGLIVSNTNDLIYVHSTNLPDDENNILVAAMKEFLDTIDNPRYILVRKDKFLNTIKQVDYYAIPAIIGAKQEYVNLFKRLWNKYIGPCEIVYTRNLEGRKLLLKARKNAFSSMKRSSAKKVSRWS